MPFKMAPMACLPYAKMHVASAQYCGSKFPAPPMCVWVLGSRITDPPIISGNREPRTSIVFPEAMRVAIGPSAAVTFGSLASQFFRKLAAHDSLELSGEVRMFIRVSFQPQLPVASWGTASSCGLHTRK